MELFGAMTTEQISRFHLLWVCCSFLKSGLLSFSSQAEQHHQIRLEGHGLGVGLRSLNVVTGTTAKTEYSENTWNGTFCE